jgi:hypothetical protein
VQVSGDVAVNIHRLADGSAAVHLVNYGYDVELDRVEGLKDVELSVRLPLAQPRDGNGGRPWRRLHRDCPSGPSRACTHAAGPTGPVRHRGA